jgi:hypothetical protein
MGPDYSQIDSIEKAEALTARGELVTLPLLPAILGGSDIVPQNLVYVPPFVTEIKRGIDENIIMPLVEQGKVRRYAATPRYQGRSIIPIAIEVSASEPANFATSIAIWGDALTNENLS